MLAGQPPTTHTLAIDDGEAEMVREFFRRYLTGAGAEEIARALNDEGSQHRGKRWSGELDYQCRAFCPVGKSACRGFRVQTKVLDEAVMEHLVGDS
jgi:hypothetical protein